jgi:hypothetical protein
MKGFLNAGRISGLRQVKYTQIIMVGKATVCKEVSKISVIKYARPHKGRMDEWLHSSTRS